MAKVLCEDCLRTYKPYTYRGTLQRAVVSDDHEWQGVDDEDHIYRRYIDYLNNHVSGGGLSLLQQQNSRDRSTIEKIRSIFPSVDDFMMCHERFNKERRTKISASFLCFDCEKYLCTKCITQHSEHFTFSEDDKNNVNNWDKIETNIIQAFNTEGDKKEEYIKQERVVLCNVVDVRDSVSVAEWEKFMWRVEEDIFMLGNDRVRGYIERNICVLNDNQTFLVIYNNSTHMKIYNNGSYVLIDTIELPYIPAVITEIPSTDPLQSLIAVSFSHERNIDIMNIQRRPADVISSINVHGECRDLAYCNNKLITMCMNYLDGEYRHPIHVMDKSGEIINNIDIYKIWRLYYGSSMCVHSESETIYVCHGFDRVTCLSLTGQVLHSIMFIDPIPRHICVDRDQNVYVMDAYLPLYRLSSDLSERVKIIDKDAAHVGRVTSIVHHKNKIYMATLEGFIYIFSVD